MKRVLIVLCAAGLLAAAVRYGLTVSFLHDVTDPTGWATWWSYDTVITVASGETMTVDFNLVGAHPLTDGFDPSVNRVAPAGQFLAPNLCTITGV